MDEIIEQILTESGYSKIENEISYFSNEDKSFFFRVNLTEEIFYSLKSKELINGNVDYKRILDGFKSLVNNGEYIALEKNSSLLILVHCVDMIAIENLQQQVLLLEEDEYFFKKYVIFYTSDSISDLYQNPITDYLRVKVNNHRKFNDYALNGISNGLAEFLVILQLFIKIPCLSLQHGTEGFTSLSQNISNILNVQETLYTALLENANEIMQMDFTRPEDEQRINDLLSILPRD